LSAGIGAPVSVREADLAIGIEEKLILVDAATHALLHDAAGVVERMDPHPRMGTVEIRAKDGQSDLRA
jgi:gamma-glutamyl:cysteine ligase YbdK (ATP-grasp superfamily)